MFLIVWDLFPISSKLESALILGRRIALCKYRSNAYIRFAAFFAAMAINGVEISSSDPGAVPGASTKVRLQRRISAGAK